MGSIFKQLNNYEDFSMRSNSNLRFKCCDCGLVHRMAFVPKKGGWISIAMCRDNVATENARRSSEVRESIQRLKGGR